MATLLQYRALRTKAQNLADEPSPLGYTEKSVQGKRIFIVGWDGPDDPENPKNWSKSRKWLATVFVSLLALLVGVCGPIETPVMKIAANEMGVSEVIESLSVALFLVGLGCGSLISGPVSEVFGRSRTYLLTLASMCIWLMGSALVSSPAGRLIFRFIAGFSGATPLVCSGGTIADLWSPLERTFAFPFFAIMGFGTPALGPVMTAWIPDASAGISWRWAEWIALILSAAVLVILVLFQPETYAPALLSWKAKHLRQQTGDERFQAEHEIDQVSLTTRLKQACCRPFMLAWHETTIQLASLYLAVVYTVLFTFFDGYPKIFGDNYNVSPTVTYTIFVGITIGAFGNVFLIPVVYKKCQAVARFSPQESDPVVRLWFALYAAPGLPISLFWMGWSARPSISIWSPIMASVLFGFSTTAIFISISMYLIDAYSTYAASAMAFSYLVRYLAAGGMTVAGIPWYDNLSPQWTLTILGCLSVLLTPLPYIFFKFGIRIRGKPSRDT